MSDFAYAYFNTELDKLDIPALEVIFDKVKQLLAKKRAEEAAIDKAEVERINAVYSKIPKEEQLAFTKASMASMWEALKDDTW